MPAQDSRPIQQSPPWRALEAHHKEISQQKIADFFVSDPQRFERFSLQAAELYFDYSKHLINTETLDLLLDLAEASDIQSSIAAMFSGEKINNTEQRPVLHTALRSPGNSSDAEQAVQSTLDKMQTFTEQVQNGNWTGFTGKAITDVVNIGIGGSDLGPAMVYTALSPFHASAIRCHFVSNVDPAHLQQTLADLDPASTLFIVASKTFTTLETLQNAQAARRWVLSRASETDLPRHFVAVSSNIEKAAEFGISPDNIFPMWDWVGGRYSLWSAIGLPIALGTSMETFRELLAGAHSMDEHFRHAELKENIPVLMALLSIWYANFFHAETQVILPYAQNLQLLPAFLQQLEMESLGKSVHRDGTKLELDSGSLVWGSAGTNGQHSFHQLLHQGTHLVPADFIACARSLAGETGQHQHLLANCFAQSQSLMQGKSFDEAKQELLSQGMSKEEAAALAPHKVISGNKPSSTILLQELKPKALGSLIAAYEHKVFAQSIVLDINAFDQWGVELGKVLSLDLFKAISKSGKCGDFDASTNGLINFCKQFS
ncbi:MAG: glucose-6-phosphate isomerase [Gammaproteobacteria bacterium]|nr:glucose-6-phosphate isomerase [Gammaproteobacteria bacterium]|tara:strand:+ start:7064 stop:8698 length:1635 start_codon:yes stop_codon:yes gene_type:complete